MKLSWLVVATSLAVSGCGALAPSPKPEFRALVRVEADPGQAIAGARVHYRDREVGVTSADGSVVLSLAGSEGQVFSLDVRCPQGFRSPDKPISVTLRRTLERSSQPEFRVSCPPAMRKLVVAIRAINGPDLPVVVLGRERTRTDASGAAHVVVESPPDARLQIQLDTSQRKDLLPINPRVTIEVEDADEIVVFEQKFERQRPKYRGRGGGSTPPTRI